VEGRGEDFSAEISDPHFKFSLLNPLAALYLWQLKNYLPVPWLDFIRFRCFHHVFGEGFEYANEILELCAKAFLLL
jgi:hypothetical protein